MKNILMVFLVFNLVFFSAFGQESVLYFEVQQARNASVYFDNAVFNKISADTRVFKNFIDTNEVFFFENRSLDVKNNDVKAMNLTIPMNKNKNIVLELVEVPEYFYDYEVIIGDDGTKRTANRDIKHYRGVVKGENNSLVAITFYKDEIMGLVCTDEGNFNITKDSLSGKHLFYNEDNLKEKPDWSCGTVDDLSSPHDSEVLFQQQNHLREDETIIRGSTIINKIVRIYVETKVDMYRRLGRDLDNVEAYIAALFNQVAILYLNTDIMIGISQLCMWTGGDPYSGTNASLLLLQFQDERTSINGDLGILLSFRGREEGIAQSLNGLCGFSTKNKLAVVMGLEKEYSLFPVYSWSVFSVTHELGHLLGSPHTHACKWNENNTAIDGCGITVGAPEGSCPNPGHPSGGGTIMSYCQLINGIGVTFTKGFGPQPGEKIKERVRNASCLQSCITNFTNQTVTTNKTIQSKAVLTVMGTLTMPANAQIIVQNGGKLVVDGGTVKNMNIHVKPGCNLTLNNNGILEKSTNGKLSIDLGATFNFLSGKVK